MKAFIWLNGIQDREIKPAQLTEGRQQILFWLRPHCLMASCRYTKIKMIKQKSVMCRLKFCKWKPVPFWTRWLPAPDAAGASVPRSPDWMSLFTISTLSSFPLHVLLLGLIFLADILILFTHRQSILHHPVLCDSSHTMRHIWADSAGTYFSTPRCLAKRGCENAMQNTEIRWDCSPDSTIAAKFLPSFMWAGGCTTSTCCYLCFHPR